MNLFEVTFANSQNKFLLKPLQQEEAKLIASSLQSS